MLLNFHDPFKKFFREFSGQTHVNQTLLKGHKYFEDRIEKLEQRYNFWHKEEEDGYIAKKNKTRENSPLYY